MYNIARQGAVISPRSCPAPCIPGVGGVGADRTSGRGCDTDPLLEPGELGSVQWAVKRR